MLFASQSYSAPLNNPIEAPAFHVVKAKKGEGVYSLLRRYHLTNNACNRAEFYALNKMKVSDDLHVDREYKLPVRIYKFDGKSIRSTLKIDDWDQAVAIKEYNEKLLGLKLISNNYVVTKRLWVPHNLLECYSSTAGPVTIKKEDAAYLIQPLFGKNHQKVMVMDQSLKNKVYYLVSGHGGPDPGAMCLTCPVVMCEDEYAYDVTLRLARYLMERSAIVHVIVQDPKDGIRNEKHLKCDHAELSMGKYPMPGKQLRRLEQRTKNINELYRKHRSQGIKEQYAIMIHIDSRGEKKRQDVFFYYYKDGTTSRDLAFQMQETFKSKYDKYQKGRGYAGFVTTRNLYMIRNTSPTALYVELGNIRNKADQKRFTLPENRQALANWLGDGLATFKP